jgi:hypothetical protein
VTPPDLKPFMKVSIVDAGHFDAQTACGDQHAAARRHAAAHLPHDDGGKT